MWLGAGEGEGGSVRLMQWSTTDAERRISLCSAALYPNRRVALVLVSRAGASAAMVRVLDWFVRASGAWCAPSEALASVVRSVVSEVPWPARGGGGVRVRLPRVPGWPGSEDVSVRLCGREEPLGASLEESLRVLVQTLSPAACAELLGVLACEGSVMFHTAAEEVLTPVCEALLTLLLPLRWCGVLVPVLPASLSPESMLEAPVPFLAGTTTNRLDFSRRGGVRSNVVLVDLDAGMLDMSADSDDMALPASVSRRLVASLEQFVGRRAGSNFGPRFVLEWSRRNGHARSSHLPVPWTAVLEHTSSSSSSSTSSLSTSALVSTPGGAVLMPRTPGAAGAAGAAGPSTPASLASFATPSANFVWNTASGQPRPGQATSSRLRPPGPSTSQPTTTPGAATGTGALRMIAALFSPSRTAPAPSTTSSSASEGVELRAMQGQFSASGVAGAFADAWADLLGGWESFLVERRVRFSSETGAVEFEDLPPGEMAGSVRRAAMAAAGQRTVLTFDAKKALSLAPAERRPFLTLLFASQSFSDFLVRQTASEDEDSYFLSVVTARRAQGSKRLRAGLPAPSAPPASAAVIITPPCGLGALGAIDGMSATFSADAATRILTQVLPAHLNTPLPPLVTPQAQEQPQVRVKIAEDVAKEEVVEREVVDVIPEEGEEGMGGEEEGKEEEKEEEKRVDDDSGDEEGDGHEDGVFTDDEDDDDLEEENDENTTSNPPPTSTSPAAELAAPKTPTSTRRRRTSTWISPDKLDGMGPGGAHVLLGSADAEAARRVSLVPTSASRPLAAEAERRNAWWSGVLTSASPKFTSPAAAQGQRTPRAAWAELQPSQQSGGAGGRAGWVSPSSAGVQRETWSLRSPEARRGRMRLQQVVRATSDFAEGEEEESRGGGSSLQQQQRWSLDQVSASSTVGRALAASRHSAPGVRVEVCESLAHACEGLAARVARRESGHEGGALQRVTCWPCAKPYLVLAMGWGRLGYGERVAATLATLLRLRAEALAAAKDGAEAALAPVVEDRSCMAQFATSLATSSAALPAWASAEAPAWIEAFGALALLAAGNALGAVELLGNAGGRVSAEVGLATLEATRGVGDETSTSPSTAAAAAPSTAAPSTAAPSTAATAAPQTEEVTKSPDRGTIDALLGLLGVRESETTCSHCEQRMDVHVAVERALGTASSQSYCIECDKCASGKVVPRLGLEGGVWVEILSLASLRKEVRRVTFGEDEVPGSSTSAFSLRAPDTLQRLPPCLARPLWSTHGTLHANVLFHVALFAALRGASVGSLPWGLVPGAPTTPVALGAVVAAADALPPKPHAAVAALEALRRDLSTVRAAAAGALRDVRTTVVSPLRKALVDCERRRRAGALALLQAQGRVRVVSRIRPSSSSAVSLVTCASVSGSIVGPFSLTIAPPAAPALQFEVDGVLGQEARQEDVWGHVEPLCDAVRRGRSCCVLGYGATGTGKSHTLLGAVAQWTTARESWGLAPRVLRELLVAATSLRVPLVLSAVEVYNEEAYDAFQSPRGAPMRLVDVIRRSGTGTGSQSTPSQAGAAASQSNVLRVEAPGQRSRVVTSEADGLEALAAVCRQRMVATTGANAESSRSHLLLSFRLGANGNGPRLVLADLAGSERLPPDASLERQRESSAINSSLSALGRCVATLASDPSPSSSSASSSSTSSSEVFVPFRESKLTRLLQDSLGGGSYVLLVATLSASEAPSESVSTMRFASRLRSMQLRPTTTVSAPAPAFTSPVAAPAPSSPQSPLPAPALRLVARKKGERVALTTPERRLRSKLAARLADASPGTLLDLLAASAASAASATEAAPKQPLPFSPTSRQPAGLAATPKTPTAAARPAAAAAAPPARTPTTYDMHGRRVQTTPQQQHSQQRPRALTALGGGL